MLRGKVFIVLNWVIDTIFEIIYCLFPLIYLTPDNSSNFFDLRTLGLLKQQNGFIMIQSLFAICLLVRKCYMLTNDLDPIKIYSSYQYKLKNNIDTNKYKPWITNKINPNQVILSASSLLYDVVVSRFAIDNNINPKTIQIIQPSSKINTNIDARSASTNTTGGNMPQLLDPISATNDFDAESEFGSVVGSVNTFSLSTAAFDLQDTKQELKPSNMGIQQLKRKAVIFGGGIFFILVGCLIVTSFVAFIEVRYNEKCINIEGNNNTWIKDHPELILYDKYCLSKSINMFNDYPCNCRLIQIQKESDITPKLLEKTLTRFDSLEGVYLEFLDSVEHEVKINNQSVTQIENFYFTKEMIQNLVCN